MSNQFENGSGSNPAAERKAQIENACTTAEEFCKNFFDRYDNKRHTIEKLYLDSATLSWNGNKVEGSSTIQKFLLEIPQSSLQCPTAQSHPSSEKTRVFAKTENQGRTKKSWNFLTQMIKLKNSMSRSICKKYL